MKIETRDTKRGRLQADIRHWRSVATVARRRAQDLTRRGWEAGEPDVQSCWRTARLADQAAQELHAALRAEGRP